ncbi:MFS transporter [Microbacterium sp. X-17]|uniref:MFS transporter n=1 Tax=Microbacterium sp. X-17 TaxID=3144404 RepID=UPI0031F4FB07
MTTGERVRTATAGSRLALCLLYVIPGVWMATWVTRTPALRDLLHASTAEMGLVIGCFAVGSGCGILVSGRAVMRFGARRVISVGAAGTVLSMPTIALAAATGQAWGMGLGLFFLGAGLGVSEVAMNVEGALFERAYGRPFLPLLHGSFSLGTFAGALLGIAATALGIPVVWHMLVVVIVGAPVLPWALSRLPPATGKQPRPTARAPRGRSPFADRRLLLIAGIVIAVALAEGVATDWLPLLLVDGHGVDPASASFVYATFALSMTIGRFAGGSVITRLGRAPVFAVSILCAIAGMAIVIFASNVVLVGCGVVMWGIGASLGFPLTISAAGDTSDNPAAAVAVVSTIGYLGFLTSPPLLGFLGDSWGLRAAMLIPLALLIVALALSPVLRARERPVAESE